MFDVGDRDLPVPTSGNWVIKGCMTKWLRFYVFFENRKKHDFLRVFLRCSTRFLEHWCKHKAATSATAAGNSVVSRNNSMTSSALLAVRCHCTVVAAWRLLDVVVVYRRQFNPALHVNWLINGSRSSVTHSRPSLTASTAAPLNERRQWNTLHVLHAFDDCNWKRTSIPGTEPERHFYTVNDFFDTAAHENHSMWQGYWIVSNKTNNEKSNIKAIWLYKREKLKSKRAAKKIWINKINVVGVVISTLLNKSFKEDTTSTCRKATTCDWQI